MEDKKEEVDFSSFTDLAQELKNLTEQIGIRPRKEEKKEEIEEVKEVDEDDFFEPKKEIKIEPESRQKFKRDLELENKLRKEIEKSSLEKTSEKIEKPIEKIKKVEIKNDIPKLRIKGKIKNFSALPDFPSRSFFEMNKDLFSLDFGSNQAKKEEVKLEDKLPELPKLNVKIKKTMLEEKSPKLKMIHKLKEGKKLDSEQEIEENKIELKIKKPIEKIKQTKVQKPKTPRSTFITYEDFSVLKRELGSLKKMAHMDFEFLDKNLAHLREFQSKEEEKLMENQEKIIENLKRIKQNFLFIK